MSLDRIGAVSSAAELAAVLRQLRRRQARQRGAREITYRALAARTGWSVGILAGYFGGQVLPPTDRFDVLVALLDATPAERGALATARDRAQEARRTRDRAAAVPRQLPPAACTFAGRARQLVDLDTHLAARPGGRTVAVISGTAGVGKTALAVQWAHRVVDRFPDGQVFVNLRGFDPDLPPADPADVVRDLLEAFGVPTRTVPASMAARIGLYRSVLAGRRVLLVLDNARDAAQVRPLLPGTPDCRMVVTSRNQLTSLVATEGAHQVGLDLMPVGEARDLLGRRLGAGRVAAEPDSVDELIGLCARLPLALAVVAARAIARPTFPLAVLVDELRRARGSLDPFDGGEAAADVRIVISCSYRYLRPAAATLLRRLGGHPGPEVSGPAAESLAGAAPAEIRGLLTELTDAHLLTEHAPGRYSLHDLLRVFAAEQSRRTDPAGDRREAARRCFDHYLHTAHRAAVLLRPDRDAIVLDPPAAGVTPEPLRDRDAARVWFERERPVLIGLVAQAAGNGFAPHAWKLAWAVADFLDWRGHWRELLTVQRHALDAAAVTGDRAGQIHTRRTMARACNRLGRYDEARAHLDRAIVLCRDTGDAAAEAYCHLNLALTLECGGAFRPALAHARTALNLFDGAGRRTGYAASLGVVGWYHALLGEYRQALDNCVKAVALQETRGQAAPSTLDSLGYTYHHLGRYREAAAVYRRAIDMYREAGDRFHEADTLVHLGDALRAAGAAARAVQAWRDALKILEDLEHPAAAGLRARLAA